MGLTSTPEARCPLKQEAAACPGMDCRECPVFIEVHGTGLRWVCAFCTPGQWDSMRTGCVAERVLPGAYASGTCNRCGNERLALMPVFVGEADEVELPGDDAAGPTSPVGL